MLTVNDIKEKKFAKSAVGYKVDDVENFLNDVIDLVIQLEKEKEESEKKLAVLAAKINEYRIEEDSLRQALLGAQKLGDSIIKEAKNRAEIIMRDATIKSENIIKNIKDDVKREEVILNKMKREVDAFRSKMLTMYGSHIELLKSLPEMEREKEEVKEEPVKAEKVEEVAAAEVIEAVETVETVEETAPAIEIQAEPVEETNADEPETVEFAAEAVEAADEEDKAEEEPEFKISGGFKFTNFDDKKSESKFGPLKFGEDYDLDN